MQWERSYLITKGTDDQRPILLGLHSSLVDVEVQTTFRMVRKNTVVRDTILVLKIHLYRVYRFSPFVFYRDFPLILSTIRPCEDKEKTTKDLDN